MHTTWKPTFADPGGATFLKEKGLREDAVMSGSVSDKDLKVYLLIYITVLKHF